MNIFNLLNKKNDNKVEKKSECNDKQKFVDTNISDTDNIFNNLIYNGAWFGKCNISFLGKNYIVDFQVDGYSEKDEILDNQKIAFDMFIKNSKELEISILDEILLYYNKIKHQYGYDVENNDNYPCVNDSKELISMIDLVGITLPYPENSNDRYISLVFNCTWDLENGVGVRLSNEKVVEVGFQDIAL